MIIFGIGNILFGMKGSAFILSTGFEKRWLPDDVEIVDGGTLGYVLLNIMSSCELLIIIDIKARR